MNTVEWLKEEIDSIRRQRYQFLLIDSEISKKINLQNIIKQLKLPSINVNMELASRLRNIPASRRSRVVKNELQSIVNEYDDDVIFLNRIQYLFDEELKQDPLGLIEYISGNKVILVNWPGEIRKEIIKYGTQDHPEYFESEEYKGHIIKL